VHPDDRARVEAVTEQAMASREPFTIEYRVIRPDGSERTVEARGDVELVSGRAVGVSGTIQDITARRTVERERELARAEAERANRAKNDFLSRMSHELRTPLNSVLGFAQLLQMDPLTPEQREQTSEIMRAGKHLLELINEVLDIAAIEAGRLQLSMEPVDAVGVARECVSLLTPLANAEEVTLGLQTAGLEGSSHHVAADQQRLKQVLLNLIANGIKYNRKNGHVALAFHPIDGGRHLRIDVTDTGHGISKDRLEKLFLPFERLGAEASGIEGTGLGLALSKSLTEAMGGVLSVTSDQGEGTTFSIDLASAEPALATAGREMPVAAETTAVRSASRTVLYIEDNLSNLRLVEGLISRRPKVSLMTAMQGSVGLVLARDHVPDLILLDLNLPDVSGEEVLLRLLSDPQTAEIPVVVLSADATKGQVKRLLDAGARAYLTKPIDVATFYEVLDEHCAEPVT
jgi:signal transduction histidine kinase/ActR/RegA family two-component response regulator